MSIKKYLSKIQEEKEINKNDRLRCTVCGRQVTVNKKGQGPLVCCGKNMVHLGTVVEAGFSKNPKGWSQDSIKKYSKTFTKNMKGGVKSKGFFDKCVKKMEGKVDNPEGFCASVKDEIYGSTYWRGKDKPESEVKKDTKNIKNVK
jgi:desulfoferrodoxin-like iron-binding protein